MLVTDKSSNPLTLRRRSVLLGLSIWCPSCILPSSTSGKPYSVFTGLFFLRSSDSLFHLESRTLYRHPKTPKTSTSGGSSTSSTTVLYCRDFQRQQCSFNQAHYSYLRGERKWLRHICSDCLVQSRNHEHHRAGSFECAFASASSETKN